jgi:hypothetical protein
MAKKSYIRTPYKDFIGKQLVVTGFRRRGLYRIEILSRAKLKGETDTDKRYMICRVIEKFRDPHNIADGAKLLIPIIHSIKEVDKVLIATNH